MKKIIFFLLILFFASCSASHHSSKPVKRNLFLLSPTEAKSFIENQGFVVSSTKLAFSQQNPVWIVETPMACFIVEVYGLRYYVLDEEGSFLRQPDNYKFRSGNANLIIISSGEQYLKFVP